MFEKLAYAAPAGPGGESVPSFHFFVMMSLIMGIMYFFMIRPQQKRQRELQKIVENLKKGDRIVTSGGMIGTVTSIQNDYVVVKVGDNENTKMEVLKSAITGLRTDKS